MTDSNGEHDDVVIERNVDAPVGVIWQMWTEPEHFKAWYGPDGASIPVANLDVRPGGSRLVCMEVQTPKGPMQLWFTGQYREVVVNKRLVYTESMCDENGNVEPPVDPERRQAHPVTTEVRVELEDIDGGTRMVVTHMGIPRDSAGATGWAMALDKLAHQLAAPRP